MLGCSIGTLFQVTVAGGSYQEGLMTHLQGVPPGLCITEEQIYADLLLRKPDQDELTSPRREPDIPIIYTGLNRADTLMGFATQGLTNGTPLVILIPNVDRQIEHIVKSQCNNRTPRPGHAAYASYQKYGECDDSLGAGFFSGRYTSTIVAGGAVAKQILAQHNIEVISYIKEAAGVKSREIDLTTIREKVSAYKKLHRELDYINEYIFTQKRIRPEMRMFEKMAVLAELESQLPEIHAKAKERKMDAEAIRKEYGIHHRLNCPDIEAADEMYQRIIEITKTGDSSGGVVEVIATGLPVGMGEPVFKKLDGELGRMMSIAAVKGVEIGAGFAVSDMIGSQCNDQMFSENGKVCFKSNNAGGITGGLSTGQPIVVRLAVKPTPTIEKEQQTIDKVNLENRILSSTTRRDPTIVSRVWPIAEAFVSIILLDFYMQHLVYQSLFRYKNEDL